MKSFKAPIAVTNLPKSDEKLHTFGQGMLVKLTNSPKLNNPPVTLAVFGAHLATYATAIAAAPHGGASAMADRASARKVVVDDIKQQKAYAQGVANVQTSAEDAVAVIVGGGMLVKKDGKHVKPDLAAKNSSIPGSVVLAALALKKRGVWYFEYSTDQKTWVTGLEALKASGSITGLATMTTYYFRYRTRTRAGLSEYSQIVSLWVM